MSSVRRSNNNKQISIVSGKGCLEPSDILRTDVTKAMDSQERAQNSVGPTIALN